MNMPLSAIAADPALALSDDERTPCEVWTRVMGYHRPVSSFNTGKKGEFAERVYFAEPGRGAPNRSALHGWRGELGGKPTDEAVSSSDRETLVEAAA